MTDQTQSAENFGSIVEAIMSHALRNPQKFCIADDNCRLTYGEYARKILLYAAAFKRIGVRQGDRIVIETNQTADFLAMVHSLSLLSAVFVPIEHNCAYEKTISFASRVSAKLIVGRETDKCGSFRFYTHEQLAEICMELEPFEYERPPKKDAVSEILFSTGTTGREKGIVMTHENNIALAQNVVYGVEMKEDNVEMIPSPLNHSHGLRRYYANMYLGGSVVLLSSVMDIGRFFGNIEKYSVNSMDMVPAALSVVMRLSKDKLGDYRNSLRYIQLGSAPMPERDREKICSLLPNTRLYNFYGSTESGCTLIYNFNRAHTKNNCIGKPTVNTTLITVDGERRVIVSSPENPGFIATKGKMNMVGYWNDEEQTRLAMENETVYSNDIGYVDEDGDVILLGRRGDVINIGGKKVSPEEIENAAKEMPCVEDCGCIPVNDSARGQLPKLFVKLKKGESFDPVGIRAFLSGKLEPYKVPAFIESIETIPRSFNGKLLRKELIAIENGDSK